jgi:xanthine/uracil permease
MNKPGNLIYGLDEKPPILTTIALGFQHTSLILIATIFPLIIPFLIASFSSELKATGDIATCQRIRDAKWKRIDMKNISAGILVDGMGSVISGILGCFGQSTSSSNVGLSLGTGATSRVIAWSTGIIIIILSFLPKLANIFSHYSAVRCHLVLSQWSC